MLFELSSTFKFTALPWVLIFSDEIEISCLILYLIGTHFESFIILIWKNLNSIQLPTAKKSFDRIGFASNFANCLPGSTVISKVSSLLGKNWLYQTKLTISESWLLWYDWNQWHIFFSLVLKWFAFRYTFPYKFNCWNSGSKLKYQRDCSLVWLIDWTKKNVFTQIFMRFCWSDLILDRKLTTFRHLFLFKRASNKDIPDEICT